MISSKENPQSVTDIDFEQVRQRHADHNLPKLMDKFRVILHPVRFGIMLILESTIKVERSDLLSELDLNSGTLERHLTRLKENRLLTVDKEFVDEKITSIVTARVEGLNLFRELKQTITASI